MQLKGRASLTAATLALLGTAAPTTSAQTRDMGPDVQALPRGGSSWDIDSGVLVYVEGDGRVMAIEPVVEGRRVLDEDHAFGARLVVDSLTGASPNGATPASAPQTFTSPSGNGTWQAGAGETPLDPTFKDTRFALSGDYLLPLMQGGQLDLGLAASKEYDFTSASGSMRYARDFFQHNTTLAIGANYESDMIEPVGGAPVPLSDLGTRKLGGDTKTVTDFVLGLTQVLSPLAIVQVNYSLSVSDGYHTDPYKILSVVDTNGEPLRYVYESRPDSRNKQAVFARIKRFMLARDVFDLSYRYMTDDWGISSHTVDTSYRWNFGERNFVEPHLRGYSQSAADFYRVALDDGEEAMVDFASADPRLGAFDGATAGIKVGHTLEGGSLLTLRLEYYRQSGKREGVPAAAAAGLQKFALEPDLSAVMFTVGFRYKP